MRKPTDMDVALGWWREAVSGRPVQRHEGVVHVGFYEMRDVVRGPRIPVHITIAPPVLHPETGDLEEPEKYVAIVGKDEKRDPYPIWTRLNPISTDDWLVLRARYDSDPKMQATRVKIDLGQEPTRRNK